MSIKDALPNTRLRGLVAALLYSLSAGAGAADTNAPSIRTIAEPPAAVVAVADAFAKNSFSFHGYFEGPGSLVGIAGQGPDGPLVVYVDEEGTSMVIGAVIDLASGTNRTVSAGEMLLRGNELKPKPRSLVGFLNELSEFERATEVGTAISSRVPASALDLPAIDLVPGAARERVCFIDLEIAPDAAVLLDLLSAGDSRAGTAVVLVAEEDDAAVTRAGYALGVGSVDAARRALGAEIIDLIDGQALGRGALALEQVLRFRRIVSSDKAVTCFTSAGNTGFDADEQERLARWLSDS